jgi:flavin-dependent dehydrogenase
VLADPHVQPPEATLSRGLEVHPHDDGGTDLDLWLDRGLIRRGYGWSVPAAGERRVGALSYDPRDHVKEPTRAMAARLDVEAVRYQGNWFPHALRAATEGTVFCVGDSAGHCFPLSGEGIRTAFYFGIACGRELRAVAEGRATRDEALRRYAAFHERHRPAFRRAARLQRVIPALPPRVLSLLLRALGAQFLVDRAFGWYLEQAHPRAAHDRTPAPVLSPPR